MSTDTRLPEDSVGSLPRPRSILYFGNEWSAENRTSSHHVAIQLAKRLDVHYVECPGLRAPSSSSRDLLRIVRKLWYSLAPPRKVHDRLHVHTLLQLPFHRFSVVRKLNHWLVGASARRIARRRKFEDFWTWFVVPHVASVAGTLGERKTIYYCIDDYAALPGVNVAAVRQMDDQLTRQADIVFIAAEVLLERKLEMNERTFVSPHGVDVDHFGAASEPGPVPADIADLPRPVVGFFGLIEAWIDQGLVEYLAKARPNWSFVMIGRVAVDHAGVRSCPNVHFLGRRDYADLPNYGRAFDAAIIPYHPTQQVQNANPLKLREYLAMGKPVVSVRTPEIEKFADVVRIAGNREEFLKHLDEALATPTAGEIAKRMLAVADSSWESRVDSVVERIENLDAVKQHHVLTGCP